MDITDEQIAEIDAKCREKMSVKSMRHIFALKRAVGLPT